MAVLSHDSVFYDCVRPIVPYAMIRSSHDRIVPLPYCHMNASANICNRPLLNESCLHVYSKPLVAPS